MSPRYWPKPSKWNAQKPVDEFAISHRRAFQTAARGIAEQVRRRFVLEEPGRGPHKEAIAHLLPRERNATIDSLKYVQPSALRNFGVKDVEDQIAVLDAILKFRREIAKEALDQVINLRKNKR